MEYLIYKLLHVFGVILFLGNIIVGLFWMRFAVRTRDMRIVAHTVRGIIAADTYFTIPGVIIISATGVMTAIIGRYPILSTGWILWPIILFIISGAAFMAKVAPLQRAIEACASAPEEDWHTLTGLLKSWELWGLIATATPIAAAIMMILKMPQ